MHFSSIADILSLTKIQLNFFFSSNWYYALFYLQKWETPQYKNEEWMIIEFLAIETSEMRLKFFSLDLRYWMDPMNHYQNQFHRKTHYNESVKKPLNNLLWKKMVNIYYIKQLHSIKYNGTLNTIRWFPNLKNKI